MKAKEFIQSTVEIKSRTFFFATCSIEKEKKWLVFRDIKGTVGTKAFPVNMS